MTDTQLDRDYLRRSRIPRLRRRTEAGGLLMVALQRYVDGAADRSPEEVAFARRVDAADGGRAAAEEAVAGWRGLTEAQRIDAVGAPIALINPADHVIDDEARAVFARSIDAEVREVSPGLRVSADTALRLEPGDQPWNIRDISSSGRGAFRLHLPSVSQIGTADLPQIPPAQPMSGNGPFYIVECAGVYCKKETWIDTGSSPWNDELYSCFSMWGDDDFSWSCRTAVYDRMDSGDDWRSDPDPLYLYGPGPLPKSPLIINTKMFEHDFGDPDKINKAWHDAARVAACAAKYLYGYDIDKGTVDAAADLIDLVLGLGDDPMSSQGLVLDPSYIAWLADQPLTHFKVQINYHRFTYHTDGDAQYYTFYRVRRIG